MCYTNGMVLGLLSTPHKKGNADKKRIICLKNLIFILELSISENEFQRVLDYASSLNLCLMIVKTDMQSQYIPDLPINFSIMQVLAFSWLHDNV